MASRNNHEISIRAVKFDDEEFFKPCHLDLSNESYAAFWDRKHNLDLPAPHIVISLLGDSETVSLVPWYASAYREVLLETISDFGDCWILYSTFCKCTCKLVDDFIDALKVQNFEEGPRKASQCQPVSVSDSQPQTLPGEVLKPDPVLSKKKPATQNETDTDEMRRLRIGFEKYLSEQSVQVKDSNVPVSVMLFVVDGDAHTLQHVILSLKNEIPVMAIEGFSKITECIGGNRDEIFTDKRTSGKESAGKEPSDKEPSGKEPAGKEPSGKEPSGKKPASNEPSGGQILADKLWELNKTHELVKIFSIEKQTPREMSHVVSEILTTAWSENKVKDQADKTSKVWKRSIRRMNSIRSSIQKMSSTKPTMHEISSIQMNTRAATEEQEQCAVFEVLMGDDSKLAEQLLRYEFSVTNETLEKLYREALTDDLKEIHQTFNKKATDMLASENATGKPTSSAIKLFRSILNYGKKNGEGENVDNMDLLLWCILTNKQELAEMFWSRGNEQICSALLASAAFKKMSKRAGTELAEDLRESARIFQQNAVDLINELHLQNKEIKMKIKEKMRQQKKENDKKEKEKKDSKNESSQKNEENAKKMKVKEDSKNESRQQNKGNDKKKGGKDDSNDKSHQQNKETGINQSEIWGIKPDPILIAHYYNMMNFMSTVPVQHHLASVWRNKQDLTIAYDLRQKTLVEVPKKQWCFEEFCSAPRTKFVIHYIVYIVFLITASFMVLTGVHPVERPYTLPFISTTQLVLVVYVVADIFEEIYSNMVDKNGGQTLKYRIVNWVTDFWNLLDVLSYISFLGMLAIQFLWYHEKATRRAFCLSLVVFYLRLLAMFIPWKKIGIKVLMIKEMLKDLLLFLPILVVFILSWGITYHALLYPNHGDLFPGGLSGWEDWRIWKIIYMPYWQIYGESFSQEIEGKVPPDDCAENITEWYKDPTKELCPYQDWMAPIMSTFYILICNLLLVNLVIAMFSHTFERVEKNSHKIWCHYRYSVVQEHKSRIPPPFNIPLRIVQFVIWCLKICICTDLCRKKGRVGPIIEPLSPSDNDNPPHNKKTFLTQGAEKCLLSKKRQNRPTERI